MTNDEIITGIKNKIEKTNYCWIWKGLLDANNKPLLIIKGKQLSVRKYVPLIINKPILQNRARVNCGNDLCVNPDHLISGDESRFWSKVCKLSEENSCWIWIGKEDKNGYGKFSIENGTKTVRAHRYSWELFTGRPIPEGILACHTCDNPRCVNPHHLFLGTNLDNMQDRDQKGRHKPNPNPLKGSANRLSKLTEEQVLEIRKSNKTVKELTVIYNINHRTIYDILNRKIWKHI